MRLRFERFHHGDNLTQYRARLPGSGHLAVVHAAPAPVGGQPARGVGVTGVGVTGVGVTGVKAGRHARDGEMLP